MAPPTPDGLHLAIQTALKQWAKPEVDTNLLSTYAMVHQHLQDHPGSVRHAINSVLLDALDHLAKEHPGSSQLLRKRFFDQETVFTLARQLNLGESTVYLKQQEAIAALSAIVWQREQRFTEQLRRKVEKRIGSPPYHTLFGVDSLLAHVTTLLMATDAPWLVALEGIGGSGKTSLADACVRHLMKTGVFREFAWVSAQTVTFGVSGTITPSPDPSVTTQMLITALLKQLMGEELFTEDPLPTSEALDRLQRRLRVAPHLIVIDNLETLRDVQTLLPTLRQLVNPTKFLLTSRESLLEELDLYHQKVTELCAPDALALVRHHARVSNLADIAASADATIRPLYEVAGGNPLALRLLIGQLHTSSLQGVVEDLQEARTEKVEHLYNYIYRHAWNALDEMARTVLVAMPLVQAQSGTLAHLMELTNLPRRQVQGAIERLIRANLVDLTGPLQMRHYTIHSLTRTFLHEQVLHWQEDDPYG